ncbi:interactor of constitutive active ROPs 3 [Cajanus cajan]|uniref:interactor of constitutive active ROPs 3 n=1 Tax=Cajanus cajan TaxID=3821 RepID=UPI00098DA00B|nr:interactor of constitutive active ROPs 3 [Cajanus cajan]XP_020224419.1 interactor of constitutive active ROPs 3 [Cajanus cajan]XP_020224421.1 interactor of constitutive active ROPs 3 [Cajanus cajan]XP_020224422.1 interactor of constitutive active ROPs 3 [Cajanus cajan]XP_029128772.1 interactor of constitutive active ROPs 3 [Cajanus cajan]
MQTQKTRSSSSEAPQKVSPRGGRQLRPTTLDTASSLNQANKTSKERSPKITDRRSPRSPAPERKRPSRISELESQISQLKDDLKVVRNQLSLSDSGKKQAQQDAEESKKQLASLSVKLEDSQQQLLKFSAAEQARVIELQKTIEEHDKAWQSELRAAQQKLSDNTAALTSAINEIQQLKVQLELVANCENAHTQIAESSDVELLNLKDNLAESLSLVENMKNQLRDSKESVQAQALVNETLRQLEAAKRTVEFLRADAAKAVHGYNSAALELDQSRARVNSLEALVSKLEFGLISNKSNNSVNLADGGNMELKAEILQKGEGEDANHIEAEIYSLRSEVGQLRYAIETAEAKYREEQIECSVKITKAYELIEQITSESSQRESELEAELKRKKTDIEELKANLMDKETELQGIVEENEKLNLQLEKNMSSQREHELRKELRKLDECVAGLKADLMDKETTLQSISEENEMLKLEISKRYARAELEAAKAAEREAVMRLGIVMEDAERSNRKAVRVAEQLEASQAANSIIEAELRRLKVQSDQWRKAAEAAAAMLSAGNNGKLAERSLSLDNNYNSVMNKYTPFCEELDDDFQTKKNGNMLKKIGVLWRKPQK